QLRVLHTFDLGRGIRRSVLRPGCGGTLGAFTLFTARWLRLSGGKLELHADRFYILELRERGQLIQALQAEVVEEFSSRAQELRSTRHLAVADDTNPIALLERAHDRRADRYPPNRYDFAAREGLSVRDERERHVERARVARRSLLPQSGHGIGDARTHLYAPAARNLDELDPTLRVVGSEQGQRRVELILRRPFALIE